MRVTRLVAVDDAEEVAALLTANREFLEPWDPAHDDSYFTVQRQLKMIERNLDSHAHGRMVPLVILDETGGLAGTININGITRGAFQSASIGYWVSREHNGRGLATAAVADVVAMAFGPAPVPGEEHHGSGGLNLHRLQAETLLHNTGSQRVLTRNGFEPFAIAPSYLNIAGRWQDFVLFHLLNNGWRA